MLNIVVQNQNSTKNKFVLLAAGAVLLAASVTTVVCANKSDGSMDDLFKANVEALARSESGGTICVHQSITPGDNPYVLCSTCRPGKTLIYSMSICYR